MDLTCEELVEIITDYLEGGLSGEDRARFEDHLEMCEGCRIYLDQMRATILLIGRIEAEQLPVEMRERLLTAFRDWRA